MRKNLLATYLVAALTMIFTQCSEDSVVPDQESQQLAAQQEKESTSARKKATKYLGTPITGTIAGAAFSAEYRITKFVAQNDVLYAIGTLNNITGIDPTIVDPAILANLSTQQIRLPVELPSGTAAADAAVAQVGSCDILFLQLGPLDLDLLGLQIHLDQVTLEIDAATGPGNLLGNLLCAITGLLDGVGTLAAIANLLNQIIDLIGTIGA